MKTAHNTISFLLNDKEICVCTHFMHTVTYIKMVNKMLMVILR